MEQTLKRRVRGAVKKQSGRMAAGCEAGGLRNEGNEGLAVAAGNKVAWNSCGFVLLGPLVRVEAEMRRGEVGRVLGPIDGEVVVVAFGLAERGLDACERAVYTKAELSVVQGDLKRRGSVWAGEDAEEVQRLMARGMQLARLMGEMQPDELQQAMWRRWESIRARLGAIYRAHGSRREGSMVCA